MRYKILLILLFSSIYSCLSASYVASVKSLRGEAVVQRDKDDIKAYAGLKIKDKDIITTKGQKSKINILFNDGTSVGIGKDSSFSVQSYVYDTIENENSKVDLKFTKGIFKVITGKIGKAFPQRFKLSTKTSTIGIRGTIVAGTQNSVACLYGKILVTSYGKSKIVSKGYYVLTSINKPPSKRMRIPPAMLIKYSNISIINSKIINDVKVGKGTTIDESNIGTKIDGKNVNIINSKITNKVDVGKNVKIVKSNLGNSISGKNIKIRNKKLQNNVKVSNNTKIKNSNLGQNYKIKNLNVNSNNRVKVTGRSSVENVNVGISTD